MPTVDRLRRLYVALMMQIVGRALAAASRVDPVLCGELAVLPVGFKVCMMVLPGGPGMVVQANGDGTVRLLGATGAQADLGVRFKHLEHAYLVLSFQEGTARAFANHRMVADGDVAVATRLVRCLDRLESLILPAFVARRAVKRYLPMRPSEKPPLALRIYGQVLLGVFKGAWR